MTPWRLAHSLTVLRAEVDAVWPHRDHASDGTIGDARHQTVLSDHNPNAAGVVRALDVDAGPGLTPDEAHDQIGDLLSEHVRQLGGHHPALGPGSYVIWDHHIASPRAAWAWRSYLGADPHTSHVHISVTTSPAGYDDHTPWGIAALVAHHQPARRSVVVKAGDSLWLIGKHTGVPWTRIAKLNNLTRPYLVHPGQRLWIS